MPIDLTKVSSGSAAPLIDPRDVFSAISKRPWPFLRNEQGEVLGGWFDVRDHQDVVIKQNTGGGKTAVGLLIAKASLNEGVGPAVYLVPDTYLIEQVVEEAVRLEIETVDDPSHPRFISGDAVLVGTLQKLINGMSAFGVDGTGREIVEIGTVVIDDAHAALATVESQFAISLPKSHEAFGALLDIFLPDLKEQSASLAREIEEGSYSALQRVPFWTWRTKQDRVLDAFAPHLDENPFKFAWPLIRDQLAICSAIFTGTQVDIRPPAPPIHKIPSFATATRRVYMTATLADDAILTQNLAVKPVYIERAVTPKRASDIGNRVILAPLELDPSLDSDSVREFARNYADGWPDKKGRPTRAPINVVVLVPSDRVGEKWRTYADAMWNVKDLKTGVPRLRAGHVGLVVLANKYDGIDLPGDACRLLIIDELPSILDPVERREASTMVKSPRVLARQVQRVEQGMGRGVRDSTDYCAVVLMGTALTRVIHDPRQRELFSPATLSQLDLSRSLSKQLSGGLADVKEAIELCLSQDRDWLAKDRAALAVTNYRSEATIRPSVVASREAFDLAVAHNFDGAMQKIRAAAELSDNPAEKGWLMEQQAVYRDVFDSGGAQKVLLSAMTLNHHVLHPVSAASLPKVRAANEQAKAVSEYLIANFADALDANLCIRAMFDQLVWDEQHSRDAEAMWQELGEVLGFGSERPEVKYGTGPDNLWALNNGRDVIFELKTGAKEQPIKKDDVDQVGGHLRWFIDEFLATPDVVIVHPSSEYDSKGTMPKGTRVMTPEDVDHLRASVLSLTAALPAHQWSDYARIAEELSSRNLTFDRVIQAYSHKPKVSSRKL